MGKLAELIGLRIREMRTARGLKQEDMERYGLNYKYYQKIETGKANVTLNTLEKVAEALGVDAAELFAMPLGRSPESNHLAAAVSEIIKKDDRKTARKVSLFIKEFMD